MSNARLLLCLVCVLAPLATEIAWCCLAGQFLSGYTIGLLAVPTLFILSLIVGVASGLRTRLNDGSKPTDSEDGLQGGAPDER
jgi:predicted lipid-binding transport protein (Tim44 family)